MEAQEIITAEAGTVALLNKSEIDMQVATAHKYPRSVKRFRDETLAMVTLNENVAQECIYSLPRDGKNIEGPSARFAEVVASAWGNSRAGARVVSDAGDFVTAQGVFHDLERNVHHLRGAAPHRGQARQPVQARHDRRHRQCSVLHRAAQRHPQGRSQGVLVRPVRLCAPDRHRQRPDAGQPPRARTGCAAEVRRDP